MADAELRVAISPWRSWRTLLSPRFTGARNLVMRGEQRGLYAGLGLVGVLFLRRLPERFTQFPDGDDFHGCLDCHVKLYRAVSGTVRFPAVQRDVSEISVLNLLAEGPIAYSEGLSRQRELVALRQNGEVPDTLLLLTHPPTITYGKVADIERHLLLTADQYAGRGIELIPTDRGGDVTYHGPGQLVGYPIIALGDGKRDLHRYVRKVEELIIRACHRLGATNAGRADFHAGVWAGDGYLAAVGVRVSRWVTHHGFALNVTDEVRENFATIVPCGVAGKRIATVSELAGRTVSVEETAVVIADVADILCRSEIEFTR
ncbi:MAG: lipoyl(octanoyl) transferase LipB [Fibrella sp.]|nr:lipoyl(octanoyl) transferase LipB [Armatimonadota bacterium]